jgi:hypothetical protein
VAVRRLYDVFFSAKNISDKNVMEKPGGRKCKAPRYSALCMR